MYYVGFFKHCAEKFMCFAENPVGRMANPASRPPCAGSRLEPPERAFHTRERHLGIQKDILFAIFLAKSLHKSFVGNK